MSDNLNKSNEGHGGASIIAANQDSLDAIQRMIVVGVNGTDNFRSESASVSVLEDMVCVLKKSALYGC
jgi:hypothetical protein